MIWAYIVCGVYICNAVLFIAWYFMARRCMANRGISWSGSYDAFACCLLLWSIFIPPIGTIFLVHSLFKREYE